MRVGKVRCSTLFFFNLGKVDGWVKGTSYTHRMFEFSKEFNCPVNFGKAFLHIDMLPIFSSERVPTFLDKGWEGIVEVA